MLETAYDIKQIIFPLELLYIDELLQTKPKKILNLNGWKLSKKIFTNISQINIGLQELHVDYTILTLECFEILRSCKSLTSVHMRKTVKIDKSMAIIFSSWVNLCRLDISENMIEFDACHVMSTTCKKLQTLICESCIGLDDLCINKFGELISRFRTLRTITLNGCLSIENEGILALMGSSSNIIQHLSLANCSCSTLSIISLRKKTSSLKYLDVSGLSLNVTGLESIAEGCHHLIHLNMSRNPNLDDITFALIAYKCQCIRYLDISSCIGLTDIGLGKGFKDLSTDLTYLDCSDIIGFDANAAEKLSSKINLTTLKMNAVSSISANNLKQLLSNLSQLSVFEMCTELHTVITHRKSLIPQFSDKVFQYTSFTNITIMKIAGACRITDIGIISFAKKCSKLQKLDCSFCSNITDESLFEIAQNCRDLKSINFSGCSKIRDSGIIALFSNCILLETVELIGCSISDASILASFQLKYLQILRVRNCSNISDASFLQFKTPAYLKLRRIDLTSLDLISSTSIAILVQNCPDLIELSADKCNILPRDYALLTKSLPLAMPNQGCRLQSREKALVEYNKWIINNNFRFKQAQIIRRFFRWAVHFRLMELVRIRRVSAARVICKYIWHGIQVVKWRSIVSLVVQMYHNTIHFQRCIRRLMGIYYARKKARSLRKRLHAAINIQRILRGNYCRRWHKRRFDHLYTYYSRIGYLAHKLLILLPARKVRRQIAVVQSVVRMRLQYIHYNLLKRGVIVVQRQVRVYLSYKHAEQVFYDTVYSTMDVVHRTVYERLRAAYVISYNWTAFQHNRLILRFVRLCALYYTDLYAKYVLNAILIQAIIRRFLARCREHYRRLHLELQARSILVIQGFWRRLEAYQEYRQRQYDAFISRLRWQRFTMQRPRLVLGVYTRPIQRLARRYIFRCQRYAAALAIQRVYYAYRVRNWSYLVHSAQANHAARAIQRCCAAFLTRIRMSRWRFRRHMAAWQITRAFRRYIRQNSEAKKIIAHNTAVRKRQEEAQFKQELMMKKVQKEYEESQLMQQVPYAIMIQRALRKHLRMIHFRGRKSSKKEAMMRDIVEQVMRKQVPVEETQFQRLVGQLPQPKAIAINVLKTVTNVFYPEDLISAEDRPRLINSVMNYQSMTVKQGGIIDLCMTSGEIENNIFGLRQTALKRRNEPYFMKIDKSIEGPLGNAFLWVMYGAEGSLICDLEIGEKPKKDIKVLLRDGKYRMNEKLCLHEKVNIQIRALQKKGARAIVNVQIAHNKQDAEDYHKLGYTLLKQLSVFGLKSSVWILRDKLVGDKNDEDDDLYPLGSLETMFWTDDRLIRCVKAFNLKEEDVLEMRKTYERIRNWRPSTLRMKSREKFYFCLTEDIFEFLDEMPLSQVTTWVMAPLGPQKQDALLFSEYLHMICYYNMLSKADMVKLIFGQVDTSGAYFITRDQVIYILKCLWGVGEGYRVYLKGFPKFNDPKKAEFILDDLLQFCNANPSIMKTPMRIQQAFIRNNLGETYWQKKMDQFRIIRKEIGAIQL